MKVFKAILLAAAVLVPASAQATIVFQVNGTYAQGGTLTGTFSTNDDRTVLESVNLTSTAFGTNVYNTLTPNAFSFQQNFLQLNLGTPTRQLNLIFSPALPASGSTSLFAGSYEAQGNLNNQRALTGSITASTSTAAVPEPATWAMMLVGFAAIGLGMRRKKQRQTVRLKFA